MKSNYRLRDNMKILSAPSRHLALLLVSFCAASSSAFAQQAAPKDVPPPPPPTVERTDESNEPGITIREPENPTRITEQREGGEVKQIKVKKGKSAYVLKPGQIGGASKNDAQGTQTHPAQWVVKEFGPGARPPQETNPPQTLPPSPPRADAQETQDKK